MEDFQARLAQAAQGAPLHPTWSDPQRSLQHTDYLSLFLFGLLNPVVRAMRGLCSASHLKRVQADICSRSVSLGSFSEAQAVLDPALLAEVKDLDRDAPDYDRALVELAAFLARRLDLQVCCPKLSDLCVCNEWLDRNPGRLVKNPKWVELDERALTRGRELYRQSCMEVCHERVASQGRFGEPGRFRCGHRASGGGLGTRRPLCCDSGCR